VGDTLRLGQVHPFGWNLGPVYDLQLTNLAQMLVPLCQNKGYLCHTDLLCHFLLGDLGPVL
jgi:hypothetical protein